MEPSDMDSFPAASIFNSLEKLKSDLPEEIVRAFKEIREKLKDAKNQSLWLCPSSTSIALLDDLNDTLAECHILKLQRASINKITSPFYLRSEQKTLQKIKSLVSYINKKIQAAESEEKGWTRTNFWTRRRTSREEAYKSTVLLFEQEAREIVDCLCSEGFKAIGIHGMCGSGKTTIVDWILKSEMINGMFAPIVKICLSDMSPKDTGDAKIVKHLLEVLGHDVDELTGKDRDVNPIDELKEKLMTRKFLIVLDDVWFYNDWLILKPDEADGDGNFFTHALPKNTGGAVIVTSRLKNVAEKIVGDECLFHLKPWEGNGDCLEAVVRDKVSDKSKVEKIVSRLHGLPLAAKTLTRTEYYI